MLMHSLTVLGMVTLASLLPTPAFANQPLAEDCVGSISTMEQVENALRCKTIYLGGMTITNKKTLDLLLRPGATLEMKGDLHFDNYLGQSAPMIRVKGDNITFNGLGRNIYCNGQKYWPKSTGVILSDVPTPAMAVIASGKIQNINFWNTPRQGVFFGNYGPLTVFNVNVDNSAGDGRAANNDGFDINAKASLNISGCTIYCQDDCMAINGGVDTHIFNNTCHKTHGLSIGSIQTGYSVRNTFISSNYFYGSVNALRIKTMYGATNAMVENVVYADNVGVNIQRFAFVLMQNYTNKPSIGLPPTNGAKVVDVRFTGKNKFNLADPAISIYVVCARGSCPITSMGLDTITFTGGLPPVVYNPTSGMEHDLSLMQGPKVPPPIQKVDGFHKPGPNSPVTKTKGVKQSPLSGKPKSKKSPKQHRLRKSSDLSLAGVLPKSSPVKHHHNHFKFGYRKGCKVIRGDGKCRNRHLHHRE